MDLKWVRKLLINNIPEVLFGFVFLFCFPFFFREFPETRVVLAKPV